MPFPSIAFCIICEQIRPEPDYKLNILGFFGVTPDVAVLVEDLGQSVLQSPLLFLLGTGPTGEGGVYDKLDQVILNPDGSVLIALPVTQPINLKANIPRAALGFQFTPGFKYEGVHTFQLLLDGEVIYRTSFDVHRTRLK